ncbi:LOW QUALITY PROTEIN: protein NDNF-like [Centruroides vittatus]|uniref:LOW QUALITY PROTEIN: protein NDNF-like n=1 Tax=Centruroides vittatus TaxID=120091 RepID=UPI00350EA7E7
MISLVILIVLLSSKGSLSSDPFKYRPEIFFDNGVLPENVEVKVYIFREEIKRIFVLIEKEQRPMFLTVTPCSSPIEWRLFLRSFPGEVARSETDVLNNHVPINHPFYLLWPAKTNLRNSSSTSGLYMLEITAKIRDTSVLIYLSTSNMTSVYPKLPNNPSLDVLKVRRNRILLSWLPSPSETEGKKIEYCISVNPRMNYPTLCSLNSDLTGDYPAPLPPSTGFGFWWEKNAKKRLMTRTKEIKKNVDLKNDITYTCLGRKTWHMVQNLEEGRTYYFDVFAVDPSTNFSSSYIGISAATKSLHSGKLRENMLIMVYLNESNGYSANFEYATVNTLQAIWCFVQSCFGPGPINVTLSTDIQKIFSVNVMDMHTIVVHDLPNSTLHLTLSTKIKQPRRVRLWLSRKYHKYPFPTMPGDKRVQLFDTLTTCESVTLAWKTTNDEKVRYCIYMQSDKSKHFKYFAKPEDMCNKPIDGIVSKGKQKVLCRRYHRFSRYRFNNVILQEIKGLEPATTYVFEVQVTKFRGKTLTYEQVWATTRKNCTNNYR